ncbi:unnamed protein product, partial [Rangifer tarandus platyrhynchus]
YVLIVSSLLFLNHITFWRYTSLFTSSFIGLFELHLISSYYNKSYYDYLHESLNIYIYFYLSWVNPRHRMSRSCR